MKAFTMYRRMIRFLTILCGLFVLAVFSDAQVCDQRTGSAMEMRVQLTFDESASDSAPGSVSTRNDPLHRGDTAGNERSRDFTAMQIQVQLQDPSGGTFQEQMPASDGQVRMRVCRKSIYRLRVIGPDIEEAILDSVQPGRGESQVTVVLHRKMTKEERKAREATISANRLRVPKKARKQLEKGDAALQKGKLETAEKYYAKAVTLYPNFEEAENSLGVVLMRQGKRTEGQAAFQRAISVNANYAPANVNLAKIAFDERRYEDACALAREALKSEPLNPGALFVAAESAFFKRDYQETVNYTRTLHSRPHQQYALAHYLAAKSLDVQHQPEAAIVEYQTFLGEDPSDPNAKRARELMTLLRASTPPAHAQTSPR